MDEVLKELDIIFQTISAIPVTHDSVDAMAVARAKLRKVHAQLKAMNVEPNGGETSD